MTVGWLHLAAGGLLALAMAAPVPPPSGTGPEAPPEDFEALFRRRIDEVRATRDLRDDLELAAAILAAAKRPDRPPEFVVPAARQAYDLAAALPEGYPAAIEAMELLAEKVPQEAAAAYEKLVELHQLIYYARSRIADRAEAGQALVEALLRAADHGFASRDYERAAGLYRRAISVALAVDSPDRGAAQAGLHRAAARQQALVRAEALAADLQAAPHDAAVRKEAVRTWLVDLDWPERAAGLLDAKADDLESKLILLAGMSLGRLPDRARLELGKWYAQLAEGAAPAAKAAMLERAQTYYEAYLEGGSDPDPARAEAEAALAQVHERLLEIEWAREGAARLPAGAVLVLTFERSTFSRRAGGIAVRDLTGRCGHAAVHGATVVKGRAGDALAFDGARDYVDLGNPAALQITGSQTIALWLMPAALGARRNPFAKAYGGEGTMTLEPDGQVNYYYGTAGGNSHPYVSLTMTERLRPGAWAHLVLVRDLAARKVAWYKDGRKVAEHQAPYGATRASALRAFLGRGYAGPYAGAIDEVAVFNRALAPAEIARLYAMGRSGRSLGGR